jgi:putative phosphoribosyl transferase
MASASESLLEEDINVITDSVALSGTLAIPPGADGIILFAHGSGSSRYSPRNRFIAGKLQDAGLATLLIDLLTQEEEVEDASTEHLRFDIHLLARRLLGASEWLSHNPSTQHLRLGYFGASTGAGAALIAAAERPELVGAIVSRGGRPDLAGPALERVETPTLLIVGSYDLPVISLNKDALQNLNCVKELTIVLGATHLFEEPGTLEQVARLATDWFARYLASASVQG